MVTRAVPVGPGLPVSPGPDRARHTALQVVDHTAQGVERGGNHVQHVALPGAEDVVQIPDTAPKLLAVLTPPVLTTPLPQHAAELIEDRQHTVHEIRCRSVEGACRLRAPGRHRLAPRACEMLVARAKLPDTVERGLRGRGDRPATVAMQPPAYGIALVGGRRRFLALVDPQQRLRV